MYSIGVNCPIIAVLQVLGEVYSGADQFPLVPASAVHAQSPYWGKTMARHQFVKHDT